MDESERLLVGKAMCARVMGAAHVVDSLRAESELDGPLQQMAIQFAWGQVWTRPGLHLKTRSLVTLAILAALGRTESLVLHTKGSLNSGASKEEIREVLMHVRVCAGSPKAHQAMRAVRRGLAEYESNQRPGAQV